MQETNYWKQFEHTGKITDYLQYKASTSEQSKADRQKGKKSNGRESNGDGAFGISHGRVR